MDYLEQKLIAKETSGEFLKVDSILTLFQDIASEHGKIMGVGLQHIREDLGAFWVVTKTKLHIKKQVKNGEEITLLTFPSKITPLRVFRDYIIKNSVGEELVIARSEWCVLDIETKRIRKICSINHPEISQFYGDVGLEFERFEIINCQDSSLCEVIITPNEIDANNHTNNIAYAKMAMQKLNADIGTNVKVKNFEIHFISQSYLGDKLSVCSSALGSKEYFVDGSIKENKIFKVKVEIE